MYFSSYFSPLVPSHFIPPASFASIHISLVMSYPCFVCDQSFRRPQDRVSHLRLKKDDAHRQYVLRQEQSVSKQIFRTVEMAASAAAINSTSAPALSVPSVQQNDVDLDDLPSSRNMDVDEDDLDLSYMDQECGIISEPEDLVDRNEDGEGEDALVKIMEATVQLGDSDLANMEELFNFLPTPDTEHVTEKAGPSPSTAVNPQLRRTLVDEDEDSRTYQWHPTAGKVYGHEPTVYARWRSLLSSDDTKNEEYKPFKSRLDWEVAQWAVKEKIPQKSFDRFLKIPQVFQTFCHNNGTLTSTPLSR